MVNCVLFMHISFCIRFTVALILNNRLRNQLCLPAWRERGGHKRHMSHENRSSGFPTRSDTNRPVHIQKMARSFDFRI